MKWLLWGLLCPFPPHRSYRPLAMVFGDAFEIPASGAVFTFGRSRFAGNEPSQFFIRNDPVRHIACGDEHTVLVCEGGRAFAFGSNDSGQLGLGHNKPVDKPMCVKSVKPWPLELAACGKSHTLLLTQCGKVFSCGANAEGQLGLGDKDARHSPMQVTLKLPEGHKIVALAAGCLHSALITDGGEIWTWGGNADGQCGIDTSGNPLLTPTKLTYLDEPLEATSLACGYYHTVYSRADGVWTMGETDNGKLGREGDGLPATRVPFEESLVVAQVAAGGSHTMVLTEDGQVYGFGSNWCGQLGVGDAQEVNSPQKLELPSTVTHISCGESHTAFITEEGEVYTCGDSRHGKLGRDGGSNKEPGMMTILAPYTVKGLACGGCHTMVLAWAGQQSENDVVLPPLKPRASIPHVTTGDSVDIEPEENTDGCIQENGRGEETALDEDNVEIEIVSNGLGMANNMMPNLQVQETIPEETNDQPVNGMNNGEVPKPSRVKKMVNAFKRKPKGSTVIVKNEGGQTSSKACSIL